MDDHHTKKSASQELNHARKISNWAIIVKTMDQSQPNIIIYVISNN